MPKAGVRVYAHRGASRELPENTMPAFQRALELGADALETDLHATADGVLVTSHDPDGARVFGVARLPLSFAQPWVIRRCHALGLRVDYWTVNEPALAISLAALGADGIMTDDPAAIVPALRSA